MASAPAIPASLRQRLAALSRRERVLVVLGAAAVLLFLVYLPTRGGGEEPVELLAPLPAPVPATTPVSYTPPSVAAAPPPASAAGMLLIGVFGGGPGGGSAIIRMADGTPRTVPVGREFQPGLTLKAVAIDHAILSSGGSDLRLELGKAGGTPIAVAAARAAPSSPPGAEWHRSQTMAYRLGLEPVMANGRVTGHTIKPGANLPDLARAGLAPGDTITRVNGSLLNEEQLMELAWTIANSAATEFEFTRGGRQMKVSLQR